METQRHLIDYSESKLQSARPRRILTKLTLQSQQKASWTQRASTVARSKQARHISPDASLNIAHSTFVLSKTTGRVAPHDKAAFCFFPNPTVTKRHCCVKMLAFFRLKNLHVHRPGTRTYHSGHRHNHVTCGACLSVLTLWSVKRHSKQPGIRNKKTTTPKAKTTVNPEHPKHKKHP